MRASTNKNLAIMAALAPLVSAHYTFSGLLINGEMVGNDWQYIREHQRGYMPTFKDELTSEDFRCNQGAGSGANTDVYTVKPGDEIGMRQAFGAGGMEHPGPAQVYMSLAPGSVKEYDGSGDWIKVSQDLACKNGLTAEDFQTDAWCTWGEDNVHFVVPETIPDGEYLVRGEHIALHGAHDEKTEFYYSCAQIKVEGSSATELPGEKVLIPGVYDASDDAVSFSVWSGNQEYPFIPGPEVAPGGTVRGSADGSSAETVTVDGAASGGNTDDEETEDDSSEAPQTPTTPVEEIPSAVPSSEPENGNDEADADAGAEEDNSSDNNDSDNSGNDNGNDDQADAQPGYDLPAPEKGNQEDDSSASPAPAPEKEKVECPTKLRRRAERAARRAARLARRAALA